MEPNTFSLVDQILQHSPEAMSGNYRNYPRLLRYLSTMLLIIIVEYCNLVGPNMTLKINCSTSWWSCHENLAKIEPTINVSPREILQENGWNWHFQGYSTLKFAIFMALEAKRWRIKFHCVLMKQAVKCPVTNSTFNHNEARLILGIIKVRKIVKLGDINVNAS